MALNQVVAVVADITGATTAAQNTLPVLVDAVGVGTDRTNGAKRGILNVLRTDVGGAAVVGNITVQGIDLPVVGGKPAAGQFGGTAQSETVQEFVAANAQVNFDTTFPFVDFAANNWMVQVQGEAAFRVVLPTASVPAGTECDTNNNGGLLRITFATAPGVGKIVRIYQTPVSAQTEIMAAAPHMSERSNVQIKQVMWAIFSGIQTAANRTLITVEPAVGA